MSYVTSERTTANTTLILKALLMGIKITKGGNQYRMDDLYRLCQLAWDTNGKEHLLVVNLGEGIPLADFVTWCAGFTDTEVIIVGSNIALNEIIQKRL